MLKNVIINQSMRIIIKNIILEIKIRVCNYLNSIKNYNKNIIIKTFSITFFLYLKNNL